ncbi:hypothetical protein PSQ20_19730 [Curvibacter sp. RS43]|uniref:Type IV pilus modification protein PilV n=1 Tax=Curvibacter microcysteis TaxID=3026419 RepID=A0ABT5MLQ5_9BURK|nr:MULTISPECIES: hypothetical protein [unclassified Curvibacter]MDD0812587.1 hypothetical protein [Curvibacter sp. RS43]MDD0816874.1 hypothetical protein [Curvibacter sp. HBC28]
MRRPADSRAQRPALQGGSALVESLVALLLFALGLLGVMGLQASAVQLSSQAQYRAQASWLANAVVSQMWASDRTASSLQSQFASPDGSAYRAWQAQVSASGLPGVSSANNTLPTISFSTLAGGGSSEARSQATITVGWRSPSEAQTHQLVTVVQLK